MGAEVDLFSPADMWETVHANEELARQREKAKLDEWNNNNKQNLYQKAELPYFPEPQDEREQLFNYQHDYLKNGDMDSKKKLYELGYNVIMHLIGEYLKNGKKKRFMTKEQQLDKAATAFEYVFRRYEDGSGWYVSAGFISVLRDGLKHALYYKTSKDFEISLDEDVLKPKQENYSKWQT